MQTSAFRDIARFLDKRSANSNENKKQNRAEALNTLYKEVGARLADTDTSILIPAFRQLFSRWDLNSKQHDRLIKWSASESKSGKHKELADDLYIALWIEKTYRDYNQSWQDYKQDEALKVPARSNELNDFQQKITSMLKSSDLSLKSKLAIVSTWISGDWQMPEECVWQCIEIVSQAYEKKVNG